MPAATAARNTRWQRVRRLEDEGYILGYGAILDQKLLAAAETVLIEVTLDKHDHAGACRNAGGPGSSPDDRRT